MFYLSFSLILISFLIKVCDYIFMPEPAPGRARLAGGGIMSRPACSIICWQTYKHSVLKMDESILICIGTSGPQGRGMKRSALWVKDQGHTRQKIDVEE